MKRKVLLMFIGLLFGLCGCNNKIKRDNACQINASRSQEVNGYKITHSLFIEEDSSRFAWGIECPNDYKGTFYFIFSHNDIYLDNKEFEYITSTNETVEFNSKYGSTDAYEFEGPKTIYIYYNNSSEKTKEIINSHVYNIEISFLKWFAKPELFLKL